MTDIPAGESSNQSFCSSCGARLDPAQQYCGTCGTPVGGPVPGSLASVPPAARQTSSKAVVSLVLSIAGILVFPVVCSVLAIILGRQAQREIRADPRLSGDGIASAGVVLGVVGLCFVVLGILLFVFFAASVHSA